MAESSQSQSSSLQEHLTDSIRRAKQRILSSSIPHIIPDAIEVNPPAKRTRTISHHHSHEDQSAVVIAMKALQDRIATLQQQKKQLQRVNDHLQANQHHRQSQQNDKHKLILTIQEKQQELRTLKKKNHQLNIRVQKLTQKVEELEEAVQKNPTQRVLPSQTIESPLSHEESRPQESFWFKKEEEEVSKKDEEQLNELKQRNKINLQSIENLMRELQEEKKKNLKWIKMFQMQLVEEEKQNNSFQTNKPHKSIEKHRQGVVSENYKNLKAQLKTSNEKIKDLVRELKTIQDKYSQMKFLSVKILQNINRYYPQSNMQIKQLSMKLMRLTNERNSTINLARHSSRKINQGRDSHSKSKQTNKRSLKISDLNSSLKKSRERSHTKSSKKYRLQEESPLRFKNERSAQKRVIDELERQVKNLKRAHKNLIAIDKTEDPEMGRRIEEIAELFNKKSEQLEAMRRG